jgi:hypothetical protein
MWKSRSKNTIKRETHKPTMCKLQTFINSQITGTGARGYDGLDRVEFVVHR